MTQCISVQFQIYILFLHVKRAGKIKYIYTYFIYIFFSQNGKTFREFRSVKIEVVVRVHRLN